MFDITDVFLGLFFLLIVYLNVSICNINLNGLSKHTTKEHWREKKGRFNTDGVINDAKTTTKHFVLSNTHTNVMTK